MAGERGDTEVLRLGEVLKAGRLRKGLTLRELADDAEIGVSATFISRVERGDALPSDELLLRLARRLDLPEPVVLMHLFRDRASPEVRAFVPSPSRLLSPAPATKDKDNEGLEAIAEPLARVLAVHREVVVENARLRAENAGLHDEVQALGAEVAEDKRRFLPDVNRFLCSLFHYETEWIRRESVVHRNGDCTVTVTLEGVRPKKGSPPIHSLEHSVFLPQASDGAVSIAGAAPRFEILEQPSSLLVEHSFRRESPARGACVISFPEGYGWSSSDERLSYRFSYRLERTFVMTVEEAKASYGRRSVHQSALEWSSCFINKPVKHLEFAVVFPEGYTPAYIDQWVWFTETSFLECDYNLASRLLADPEDGIEIESGDRTVVRLRAKNPLLGFSYGIVWQPLPKRQFLSLLRG